MPYVNVKVAGTLSKDQKQVIANDITESLEKNAGKPKAHTYVVFDEIDRNNWAVGDQLLSDRA
jgi:4-oxalocrotonate tautomerase